MADSTGTDDALRTVGSGDLEDKGLKHGSVGALASVVLGVASEEGSVDPERYVQIGMRGYWPGEEEFAWQSDRGITSLFMHEVRDLGIEEVTNRAVEVVGSGPVFLTVDLDVLDPAFAPARGRRSPGG